MARRSHCGTAGASQLPRRAEHVDVVGLEPRMQMMYVSNIQTGTDSSRTDPVMNSSVTMPLPSTVPKGNDLWRSGGKSVGEFPCHSGRSLYKTYKHPAAAYSACRSLDRVRTSDVQPRTTRHEALKSSITSSIIH
ncbi:hypothetical protein L227DRAFT_55678 [Lentinus tigrinus ALCF2SS1-6]|uniref:Uncharacterized protein n=1 Tax=Lentinus tigrinus ALCF2SS1-6 TaxID=1328759 RepID=A0A5C2SEE3_9APHY|nr:hypothetical protein L227DRAFT_55678 [Lentinus tigrinus ALCF2SS1-6]